MALTDILRERVSRRGRTARVECGALGTVTVEALSPRECAALGMKDGGRALLYAACRELQAAGETLRRERRLFTPDEVTQYVSDGEALAAARTVLALSGVTPDREDSPDMARPEVPEEPELPSPEAPEEPDSLWREVPDRRGTRPEAPEDIPAADGETSSAFFREEEASRMTPDEGAVSYLEPQAPALPGEAGGLMPPAEEAGEMSRHTADPAGEPEVEVRAEPAGEPEAEPPEGLRTAAEFREQPAARLYRPAPEPAGDVKMEPRRPMDGTTPEFRDGLHETTPQPADIRRQTPDQTVPELAERVAEQLLEGLRRAAAVR